MKIRIVTWFLSRLMILVVASLRCHWINEERIELARQSTGRGVILVGWHGTTFIPVPYMRDRGYWSMISTSRDGEYQDQIFKYFGFNTVRGSSSARGAVRSTLRIVKELKAGAVLAHTPDGPRGPRQQFQPGAIYMSMRSGCPIISLGIYGWPCISLPTWDRYRIPYPFAKAAVIFGEPHFIPDGIDQEEQQRWADLLAAEINTLEEEAARMIGCQDHREMQMTGSEPDSLGRA